MLRAHAPNAALAGAALIALVGACATASTPGEDDPDSGLATGGPDAGTILPPRIDGGSSTGPDGNSSVQCPTNPCDLHQQCGCADGEACDLEFTSFPDEATGGTACRSINAAGTEQDTCSALEDCDVGYLCSNGQCREYCEQDSDCTGAGSECTLTRIHDKDGDGETEPIRDEADFCTTSCAPDFENQGGCPSGFGCFVRFLNHDPNSDGNEPLTDCLPLDENLGFNEICEFRNDCAAGLDCFPIGDGSESRCRFRCREGQTCENGEACNLLGTVIEGVEYGACPP